MYDQRQQHKRQQPPQPLTHRCIEWNIKLKHLLFFNVDNSNNNKNVKQIHAYSHSKTMYRRRVSNGEKKTQTIIHTRAHIGRSFFFQYVYALFSFFFFIYYIRDSFGSIVFLSVNKLSIEIHRYDHFFSRMPIAVTNSSTEFAINILYHLNQMKSNQIQSKVWTRCKCEL